MNEDHRESTPEEIAQAHLRKLKEALRHEIIVLLDDNRTTITRRATLSLTKKHILDDQLKDEIDENKKVLNEMLDLMFEQIFNDQKEGR